MPYDEIRAPLFSNGVASAGLASIDRWREVLANARYGHGFVGVDETAFPDDVEVQVRYHEDIPDEFDGRHPHLPPLSFEQFDALASESDEYAIE